MKKRHHKPKESQPMSGANLPPSEYDRAGDFYFDRLKRLLASPDFFFHENVDIMRHMLGDVAQTLASVEDACFDVVICNMALMDIPVLDATMKTVHRILKAGGTFLYCILHPCFETPFDANHPPHELDDGGNVVAIRITQYRTEGKWFSDGSGIRGTLGSIHRMLSTYLNALIQASFTIAELQEPLLDLQEAETLDQQLRSIAPRVLIVKAIAT